MSKALVVSAFGSEEKLSEMYEVQGLGVTPEKQGRGYGTALVRKVLDMVSLIFSPAVLDSSVTNLLVERCRRLRLVRLYRPFIQVLRESRLLSSRKSHLG